MGVRKLIDNQAEVERLQAENASLLATIDRYQQQVENLRGSKYRLPKASKAKASKTDFARVVIPDVHGCKANAGAVSAFLSDLEQVNPTQIVLLGDLLDCGGFLALHHTMSYGEETTYTYEDDISASMQFLDEVQKRAPRAEIHYIEGNHERRIETWCTTKALSMGSPKPELECEKLRELYAPEVVLDLDRRKINHYRNGKYYHGLPIPCTIKLGRMHFTHGISTAQNCAAVHVSKFNGNVCYGHSHRADSAIIRTVSQGVIGAWNPGTLSELQPLWRHTSPTNWSHGWGLQLIANNEDFMHINVPIYDGRSLLQNLTSRIG